jgi:hypothetical protein
MFYNKNHVTIVMKRIWSFKLLLLFHLNIENIFCIYNDFAVARGMKLKFIVELINTEKMYKW